MAKKWIQKANKKMAAKGTKGSFSAAAKKNHRSVSAYANKVLASNSKASTKMKRKAIFAKNMAKIRAKRGK